MKNGTAEPRCGRWITRISRERERAFYFYGAALMFGLWLARGLF